MDKNLKIIIAPHQVSQSRINEIESLFGIENCIRFSQIKSQELNKKVLIIDNIGMLSSLYRYGIVAYIGGGFGKGIHNTLEAAVYGIPLVFGSNFHKFDEAKALINCGAAFEINNEASLNEIMHKLLTDGVYRKECGLKASQFITDHEGSLEKIMSELKSKHIIN
jgi:3-deoxy-D-manno-octulosonic-acid transferase